MAMTLSLWLPVLLAIHTEAAIRLPLPKGFPQWRGAGNWTSPEYPWQFEAAMPLPPVAQSLYTQEINGTTVEFYSSSIEKFQKQIYPNLGMTDLVGYDSISPGPTYVIQRGRETIIRYTNNGVNPASPHLHGSWTRSPWDGWADDQVQVGQYKDYYYPNTQSARTLWYHDHSDHFTSVDAYYGQNGFYIIDEAAQDQLGLPSGKYDVPIALMDKRYLSNGKLYSPANDTINFFGDIIHANGQPWPFLNVEPRKYRLRLLNTCLSRAFELWFNDDSTGTWMPLSVIGSDGGLFSSPVNTTTLVISMGERYEVIFDFSPFAGKNITVGNNMNVLDIAEFDSTNKVMRFVVGQSVTDNNRNEVPSSLGGGQLGLKKDTIDHVFDFQRTNGNWTINGVTYSDVKARVLARPPQGTVENWQLRYANGPGVHPVHVHLIDFDVVSRNGGRGALLPYETAGSKDVVLLEPGEVVNVVARYGPWNGLYQFHCHNLIHEDHEMMDVMNVTALQELGYSDAASFADPNDARFAPRQSNAAEYQAQYITATVMPSLAGGAAYRDYPAVSSYLSEYWSTRQAGESPQTASASLTTSTSTLATSAISSSPLLGSSNTLVTSVHPSSPSPTNKPRPTTSKDGGLLGNLLPTIQISVGLG